MIRKIWAFATLLILCAYVEAIAKDYTVISPDGKNIVTVSKDMKILVSHDGKEILSVKACLWASDFTQGKVRVYPKESQGLVRVKSGFSQGKVLSEKTESPFYRQKNIQTSWREMHLKLDNGIGLEVRAYDDGVAYRFYTTQKGETVVSDETADFCFPKDSRAWLAYSTNDEKPFAMAFQNYYHETLLSEAKDKYAFLPATIECGDVKVTILESDLRAYPGMFLKSHRSAEGRLLPTGRKKGDSPYCEISAAFAKYPKKMGYYKWRGMSYVEETEDYIARSTGARTYPWRVMAITENDTEMPVNNLVYALGGTTGT